MTIREAIIKDPVGFALAALVVIFAIGMFIVFPICIAVSP